MKQKPHYIKTKFSQDLEMYAGVIANCALIISCLLFAVLHYQTLGPSVPFLLITLLVGYFLADFFSGMVHWAMDTWFDVDSVGRSVAIAREHHIYPQSIFGYRFLDHASLGSIPGSVVFWPLFIVCMLLPLTAFSYAAALVIMVICTCLLFGTTFHNFGHRRGRGFLLRNAQKYRLVMTPEHHAVHHMGDHTVHYCAVNGWANPVCDKFGVWRGLEKVIARLTGAIPRRNDVEWLEDFKKTGKVRSFDKAPT